MKVQALVGSCFFLALRREAILMDFFFGDYSGDKLDEFLS